MKIVELASLGRIVTGKTPSSENPEDFGDQYCFVTPTDSIKFKFVDKTERSLSEIGVKRLKGKLLPSKSVLVSCIGSAMGKVVMNSRPCITNQQFNSIIVDQTKNSPDYVYYALKNNYKLLRSAATGSTALPLLNKTDFDRLKLRVHSSKAEQLQIAGVLSALDAKIALNQRMNEELEGMAKLLYDYWFAQFDFPMTAAQAAEMGNPKLEGKPYRASGGPMTYHETLKREIPKGWEVFELSDVISRSGTGLNPRDNFKLGTGNNYYVTIKSIKNGKIVLDDKCDRVDDDVLLIIDRRSQLQVGDVLFTSIEPVGVTYLIHEKPTNWNINESVFTLRPEYSKATSEYLFFLVSSSEMKSFTKKSSVGSIHKGIRHAVLKTFKFAYGGKSLIEDFSRLTTPILKRIDVLDKETQELTTLRDWLLPMLMNGQVTVN